jgi:ferric-dicitrate binding protein FerR (iron transport regulator)
MRKGEEKLARFALAMFMGLSAFSLARGGTPDVVGKVVRSSNATVDGGTLLSNGTILSGDAVMVGEGGSVLLSYSPTGRAVLAPATHVRFSSAKGNIVAQLLSGTLAVAREHKDAFVVKTGTYRFEPQGEGKAEFLVELLPDQRTIVEAQQGRVAITETSSGERYTLAEGLRAEIPAFATGFPGQEDKGTSQAIGQVAASAGATRNGKPLPVGEKVVDGDSVSTGAAGHAVIQLGPTSQVTLNENTSVSFKIPVQQVWLQLQKGTVVAENTGLGNVLVATTRFHIEPTSTAPSKIYVGVMTDNSTYIESLAGDVRIEDTQAEQSYLLPAGQNTLVPANASGVTGLQPLPAAAAPTPVPTTPPSQTQTASAPGGNSHKTLLILGIAGGAGVAGAVAALAGHGSSSSSSQPVSPSAP